MAYVRWSSRGGIGAHPYISDVYIFDHIDGGINCCGCHLLGGGSHRAVDAAGMVAHIGEHLAAGHHVPGFVVPSLLGEAARHPDATLQDLLSRCGPGDRIATVDADVPERCRIRLEDPS